MEGKWELYMIRCADGSIYTGIAIDVQKRFRMHQSGKGAQYTKGRGPLSLVYMEYVGSHSEALRKEYAMKQLSKSRKEEIIREFSQRASADQQGRKN